MAKVDNFDLFSDVLLFKEDLRPELANDVFYMVQIMTRTKDTGEKPKHIHSLFVESREYLMSHKDMIVKLCETFNARAYINVNPSSYKKCVLESFSVLSTMVENEKYRGILSLPETMAGAYTNPIGKAHKKWVVDLDDIRTEEELEPFIRFILNEYHESKRDTSGEVVVVPTVSGSHLLVTPFDKRRFKERWPNIQIHENSPSILYYGG
jgi:hypothetical protein